MSVVFVPKKLRGNAKINQETIQQLLDENDQLVRCITEYMQKGRAVECVQYQQILHRNLVYLATIADASPETLPPASSSKSCDESTTASANKDTWPAHRLVIPHLMFYVNSVTQFELLINFIYFLHCWYTCKDSVASSREQQATEAKQFPFISSIRVTCIFFYCWSSLE